MSQISQIIFVEKKLSCGEILGDFATISALSCGEKLSPKLCRKNDKYEVWMKILETKKMTLARFSFNCYRKILKRKINAMIFCVCVRGEMFLNVVDKNVN